MRIQCMLQCSYKGYVRTIMKNKNTSKPRDYLYHSNQIKNTSKTHSQLSKTLKNILNFQNPSKPSNPFKTLKPPTLKTLKTLKTLNTLKNPQKHSYIFVWSGHVVLVCPYSSPLPYFR